MFAFMTAIYCYMFWLKIPEYSRSTQSSSVFPQLSMTPRSTQTARLEPCWRRWMQCFPEIMGFRKSLWMSEIKNIEHKTWKNRKQMHVNHMSTDTKTRGIKLLWHASGDSGDNDRLCFCRVMPRTKFLPLPAFIARWTVNTADIRFSDASWFLVSDISTCPLPCAGDLSETRRPDLVVAEGGPRRKTPGFVLLIFTLLITSQRSIVFMSGTLGLSLISCLNG